MRHVIASLSLLAVLAGCTAANTAQVTTTLATAQADAQKAITFYQTIKGIALVAEAADPAIAPQVGAALTVTDAAVAVLQSALASANADAPSIEAQVATITSQAVSLSTLAAPAVKVVSNKT